MALVLEEVLAWMALAGYHGLFVTILFDSVGAPLPSEAILSFAGFLVARGEMEFLAALLTATSASLTGFWLQYLVGRYGGRPFLRRYGRYLGVRPEQLERVDRWFTRYGPLAVCFGRMVPVVRGLISLPAGSARMPIATFLGWSGLGAFGWNALMLSAGYWLGARWESLLPWIDRLTLAVLAAFALALAGRLLWPRLGRR